MRSLLVVFAVGIIALSIVLIFVTPEVHSIVCPGGGPKWMLDAQNYQGGCSEVLPSDQAPPNADWTIYCGGPSPYPVPSDPYAICPGI